MIKILDLIKKKKYEIIDIVLIISAFLSIWSNLRIIPIVIYSLNFFTFKRHVKASFVFFTIAIGLSIYSLLIKHDTDLLLEEMKKKGFQEKYRNQSLKNINDVADQLEKYKSENGYYPKSLVAIEKDVYTIDVSYKLSEDCLDNSTYYYELLDSGKYYLSGVGRDGIPKTKDDLLPMSLEK
jgi:hypothetical protein